LWMWLQNLLGRSGSWLLLDFPFHQNTSETWITFVSAYSLYSEALCETFLLVCAAARCEMFQE
jgi:hypothetical protein